MIIWINGALGIGKTSTALKIKELLKEYDVEVLDSDYFYNNMILTNKLLALGGTSPQNNINFINFFKNVIEEKIKNTNKIIIIVMAITHLECKEKLFEPLIQTNKNILHIILTANKNVIEMRINNSIREDKKFALQFLEEGLNFLDCNFKNTILINTDNKSIYAVAKEIIDLIRL